MLYLHCTFAVPSLHLCTFIAPLLYLHCTFAVPSLHLCCTFIAPLLYLHCTFAVPSLHFCCTFIAPLLYLHCTFAVPSAVAPCCSPSVYLASCINILCQSASKPLPAGLLKHTHRWLVAGPLLLMVAVLLAMGGPSGDEDEDREGNGLRGSSLPLAASTSHAY